MDHTPNRSSSNPLDPTRDQSADLSATANALVGEVAQTAKEAASDLAGRARRVAEEQLSSAKQMAADRIGSVADALRATGDQLRSQDVGGVGDYVDQAVDRLDAASGYLQSRSFSEVIADVEGYARREPALVLGGAFVAGLLLGRFFKSSGSPAKANESTPSDEQSGTDVEPANGSRSFVPGVI